MVCRSQILYSLEYKFTKNCVFNVLFQNLSYKRLFFIFGSFQRCINISVKDLADGQLQVDHAVSKLWHIYDHFNFNFFLRCSKLQLEHTADTQNTAS